MLFWMLVCLAVAGVFVGGETGLLVASLSGLIASLSQMEGDDDL